MARVSWQGDGTRVRRLSPAAIELLMRLCTPGALIVYVQSTGKFGLTLDGKEIVEPVQSRTVDVLAAPRLITRSKTSNAPSYLITDAARDLLRTYLQERCARLGHDPSCSDPVCCFNPDSVVA